MKTNNRFSLILILSFGLIMSGHAQIQTQSLTSYSLPSQIDAMSLISPTQGNTAEGTVTFSKVKGGVRIILEMKGLTPGKHGIHIHEFGDCSAPDASSAGAHFNPEMLEHAGPMDHSRHEGDLGNIVADENGNAHLDYVDTKISLKGKDSIIGKSIIVHQNEDDLKTQPTGNAGPRIACGVIKEGGC
ncbi:MAG TPA: superoxide dismutase family protein [Bacteroidales bacterium]